MMDREQIKALLPHREPFLLVDQVVECIPGKRVVGLRQVQADEPWFAGHFPGRPILPGVLVTEALAQVAALVYLTSAPEAAGREVFLVGLDKMRFRAPVRPGDLLRLEVEVSRQRLGMWVFDGTAWVGETRVASGTMMATIAQ
jgi:3-hydroxyacyl-[acyl-carrier-protein] dehydratase